MTFRIVIAYGMGNMKEAYTTAEVTRTIVVDKSTLLRWPYAEKITEPKHQRFGGVDIRI